MLRAPQRARPPIALELGAMGEGDQGEIGPEQGGVFGNLPRSRPGTRSPRRESPSRRRPGAAGESPPEPSPEPPPEPAAQPEAEPTPPPVHAEAAGDEGEPDRDAEADREGNGLEELAWAGVAAAAEAATIGVRLASRAMEALRDSVERR